MVSKKGILLFTIVTILFIIVLGVPTETKSSIAILFADITIIVSIALSSKNLNKNLPFVFFNVTYFTFILGGCTFSLIEGNNIANYVGNNYSLDEINIASYIAFWGISIIDILYLLFSKTRNIKETKNDDKELLEKRKYSINKSTQIIIIVLFAISLICKFIVSIEKMIAADTIGYVGLYTRESSRLPSIIIYTSSFFYFLFTLFLSTYPNKKKTYIGITFAMLVEVIILSSGDRGEPVCALITILLYIAQRSKLEKDFLKSKKKAIICALLLLPIGIYILQSIKYTRQGNTFSLNIFEAVIEFFKSQGVTFNILLYTVSLGDSINKIFPGYFLLGELKGYLTQNALIRNIFGIPLIRGNSLEMATSGFSFGSTISYLTSKYSYLNGIGAGTSYLAELYCDLSIIGIIIGSTIIVLLLKKMQNMDSYNGIKYAILLNIFRCIISMPRGEYFKWLTEAFSIPNLILLIAIIVLNSKSRRTDNEKNITNV